MEFNADFFKIENKIEPKQGTILLSEPFSQDSFFGHSVVLLTEHDDNGSIGFILNKPVNVTVNEVIKGFPKTKATVSLGGPVNTESVHFIHTLGDKIPDSRHVLGNVYWGGSFEVMQILLKSGQVKDHQVRFFIGYSGWRPQQLHQEIEKDYWLVTDMYFEDIMIKSDENLWRRSLNNLGSKYKIWANFPDEPILN